MVASAFVAAGFVFKINPLARGKINAALGNAGREDGGDEEVGAEEILVVDEFGAGVVGRFEVEVAEDRDAGVAGFAGAAFEVGEEAVAEVGVVLDDGDGGVAEVPGFARGVGAVEAGERGEQAPLRPADVGFVEGAGPVKPPMSPPQKASPLNPAERPPRRQVSISSHVERVSPAQVPG